MQRTDYDRFLEDPERRRCLRREELILEVTEAIVEAMARAGVTQTELAARLGKTRGHVSQLLAGGRNLTIGTLAAVAGAIGCKVEVRVPSRAAAARRQAAAIVTRRGTEFVGRGGTKATAKARLSRR